MEEVMVSLRLSKHTLDLIDEQAKKTKHYKRHLILVTLLSNIFDFMDEKTLWDIIKWKPYNGTRLVFEVRRVKKENDM